MQIKVHYYTPFLLNPTGSAVGSIDIPYIHYT